MAFVYKSDNRNKIKIGETESIGPGEYLPQTELKIIKINKEPFLVGETRSKEKFNDVPGPGSYYQDDVLINYLKNLQNEKISKQSDKDLLIPNPDGGGLKENVEKFGFISKEKRFRIPNSITPGPGSYFPPINNTLTSKEKENIQCEVNRTKKVFAFKKDNIIPSIPSHNLTSGFDILKNGELCRRKNPEMYKTFSGEKGDTVGPGNYEIDTPQHWHKTGTEWSKFKVKRNEPGKTSSTFYKTNRLDEPKLSLATTAYKSNETEGKVMNNKVKYNIKDEDDEENKNKEIMSSKEKKNVMKCRVNNCKNSNRRKANIGNTLENAIDKNFPGPGYYYDEYKDSCFKFKPTPEYKQFFGSRLERFKAIKIDNQIGPTTYFNDDNKNSKACIIQQEKMSRTVRAPFNYRTNRFFKLIGNDKVPGPGQYDIPKSFSQGEKTYTNTFSRFGSCEKRFCSDKTQKWLSAIPGPGSYIDPFNENITLNTIRWKGMVFNIDKTKNINKTFYHSNSNDKNLIINNGNNKSKDEVPPVGHYNPQMVYTIDYNVKKKQLMQGKNKDIAFSTCKSKKEVKKTLNNVGPGYYYKEKRVKKQQIYPPFKQSDVKWKSSAGEFIIGPGQYNIDTYFDWNKKSFNMNFV